MNRLWVLVCALFFGFGCASDGDNGSWGEAWKDARGDNMKMHADFSSLDSAGDGMPSIQKPD